MTEISLNAKQLKKRKRIINAAIKLFVQHGIQGTSMQLLAKRADVATGTIYNYFESKEVLIHEIFVLLCEEELAFLLRDYDPTLSVRQRFEHMIRNTVIYKSTFPNKFLFRAQYVHLPNVMSDIQNGENFADHPWRKIAEDGQKQGLFKPQPLEELYYFVNGGITSFIQWKLFAEQKINEEDLTRIVDMIWDAMAKQ